MNLKDLLAVSGLPGIYRIAATRTSGLVIENLDTNKTQFCTMRKHQFTPMETVAIYTMSDTIEIGKVFQRMLDQLEDNPPVNVKGPKDAIKEYFEDIIPDYDKDKVYIGDMVKVIKWFNYLNDRNYLTSSDEEE